MSGIFGIVSKKNCANTLLYTTLRYQRIDDMVQAIGLPREKLCLYCWNGESLHSSV